MPEIKINRLPQHNADGARAFNAFNRNVYSQAGEDSVIEEIFRIMGAYNGSLRDGEDA